MAGLVIGVTFSPEGRRWRNVLGPGGARAGSCRSRPTKRSGAWPGSAMCFRRTAPRPRATRSHPGTDARAHAGRARRITVVNRLAHPRGALARHRAGELLRRRSGWSGRRHASAADRARRLLRRALHAAARGHVHLPHPRERAVSVELRSLRRAGRRRFGTPRSIRAPTR